MFILECYFGVISISNFFQFFFNRYIICIRKCKSVDASADTAKALLRLQLYILYFAFGLTYSVRGGINEETNFVGWRAHNNL